MLVFGIGGVLVVAILAVVAVLFLKKPEEEGVEKTWTDGTFAPMGGAMPAMPNMGAQPAVMMPSYAATPAPTAGMPNMYAQPAAQPVAAAVAPAVVAPVAQPAPVQPDPAREYYNGLIAQGYPQANAIQYTQQYYPTFQG
jgi:hypothetical protein